VRVLIAATVIAAALAGASAEAASPEEKRAVLANYADIAAAEYEDSLATAKALRKAVGGLIAKPSAASLTAARGAWKAARAPYQQTEAFRFGNAIVDDWEGRVNAWPLDEGLIDYVDAGRYGTESDANPYFTANIIANRKVTISGRTIDAGKITAKVVRQLQEIDEIEANVAIGYHAIEFLLWGQDLNGTGPGAGNRPHTDYDTKSCTGGNCDRRGQYLKVVSDLLVADLAEMAGNWSKDGAARKALLSGDPDAGLAAMLTGMGSLSYGELAGERMKLGLILHDPEEEHDCFSDNTHWSHYYDVVGIRNVYLGRYVRTDGRTVSGPSLGALVAKADGTVHAALTAALDATLARLDVMVKTAEDGKHYDQMLAEGDAEGNRIVQDVIDALLVQTKGIERAVAALGLSALQFEGSDSLDSPATVHKQ
jgi:putative iron-regulated protein